ncbi:EAL domain-containing protein [Parafrankia discariae]|uniref:EAL domain-containing protein n=1 Tax=Parafrankia discariae TaxID=365528 RepID=UPI0003A91BB3|nr:EAL domain-containing protein [Parafrankia discariae]
MTDVCGRDGATPPSRWDPVEPDPVAGLLATARRRLNMDLCWFSRLIGGAQVIEACDGDAAAFGVHPGSTVRHPGPHRSSALAGRPAPVIRRIRPEAVTSEAVTSEVGSYIGVPVTLADGRPYGMLCCLSRDADVATPGRKARSLALLAEVLAASISGRRSDGEDREAAWWRIWRLIDSGGPTMVFQPVFDLPSLDCLGAEALARFPPGFGGAERWFADAAAVGLGVALELSAIRSALPALSRLPPEFGLGVNASPATILSGYLADAIADVPADRLVVEVTEQDKIEDYPLVRRALDTLRRQGVRIAVDDVGAGYASLHHLVQLQPDFIKMDQCLTRRIDADPARRALATALVQFAQETGGLVLAEGVETARELGVLIGTGVHQAQGHYLAPPGPLPLPASANRTRPLGGA